MRWTRLVLLMVYLGLLVMMAPTSATSDAVYKRGGSSVTGGGVSGSPWTEAFYAIDAKNYDDTADGSLCVRFDAAATITDLNGYRVGGTNAQDLDLQIKASPDVAYSDAATVCGTGDTVATTAAGVGCTTDLTNTTIDAGEWLCLVVEESLPENVPVGITANGTYD